MPIINIYLLFTSWQNVTSLVTWIFSNHAVRVPNLKYIPSVQYWYMYKGGPKSKVSSFYEKIFKQSFTVLKIQDFWDETLCHWLHSSQHFKQPQYLHHQGIFGLPNPDYDRTAILWNNENYSALTQRHIKELKRQQHYCEHPSNVYDIIQHWRHTSVLFSTIISSPIKIIVLLCDEIIHTLATISSAMIPGHLWWTPDFSISVSQWNSALTVQPHSMKSREHRDSPKDTFHNLPTKKKSCLLSFWLQEIQDASMATTLFSILGCHNAPMPCVWSQSHLEFHQLHYDTHHQLQALPTHAVLHNSFRSFTNQKAYSFWKTMLLVDKFHGHMTWPNKPPIWLFEFSRACLQKHSAQCAQCCHLSWWSATHWFITNVHSPILEFITPKSNMFL